MATFICPLVYKVTLLQLLQKVVRWNPSSYAMYRVSVVLKFQIFVERAALGSFYLSFGLRGEKIVLDTAPAKRCEMESI